MNLQFSETRAQSDYQKILKHAFWREVRQRLGLGCNDLISFDQVFPYLRDKPHYDRGIRSVELIQIVGSSGRQHDFDLAFNPLHDTGQERWINVAKARYDGVKLPPVLLYKVGEAYFVEDGNHRISIALANGETSIQAKVTEIDVSHMTPEPSCTRLGYQLNNHHTCRR